MWFVTIDQLQSSPLLAIVGERKRGDTAIIGQVVAQERETLGNPGQVS